MGIIKSISKVIDTINDKIGTVCAYISAPLMLLIVFEVVTRKLGMATIWGYETIVAIYGWLIMMVSAYGLLHDAIVKVDILSGLWSEYTKRLVSLVTYIIFFLPFITFLIPAAWNSFFVDFTAQARSWSSWAPLMWPQKLPLFIGVVLLWLQGISEILKNVIYLVEHKGENKKAKKEILEEGAAE